MEIICAGYPKTGSKSCSAALRVLGYNVADYIETLEFFGETWQGNGSIFNQKSMTNMLSDILNRLEDFFDGKIDAKAVLDKYKEEGFDANQDFPGNFLWEELYQARDPSQVDHFIEQFLSTIANLVEGESSWSKSYSYYS